MKSRIRRRGIAAAAAVFGLAAVGVSLTTPAASGEPITVAQAPSTVEDGGYPNAEQILAERGITLTKGDGGIMLADCAQVGSFQVKVLAVTTPDDDSDQICFAAPGTTGFLAFTIPDAYRIYTYGRSVKASLSTNEQPAETVEVAKDSTKGIGESIDPNAKAVLLELRITG